MLRYIFLLTLLVGLNSLDAHAFAKPKYRKEDPNCYQGVPTAELTWGKTQALFESASIPTPAELMGGWKYIGRVKIGRTYIQDETEYFCTDINYNPDGIVNGDGSFKYYFEFYTTESGESCSPKSARVNVLNAFQWGLSQSSVPVAFETTGACFPVEGYFTDGYNYRPNYLDKIYQCRILRNAADSLAERLICAASRDFNRKWTWNHLKEACAYPESEFQTEAYLFYDR